ncbi:MAG: DUF1150 domain-containing protein [Alphaproteobacteria bacterium]|nr:MAG: DUF1150 domain-containing protein [Alphaproteobacteria bacterium]
MKTKYEFPETRGQPIVYVRPIKVEELPEEIRREIGPARTIYAVHDEEGQRLALVRDRNLAFVLARQHDYTPVNVH